MTLLAQFPLITLVIFFLLALAGYRMVKSFQRAEPGPESTPSNCPGSRFAAPLGQYRLVGFDQYDKTDYVAGDYPTRAQAVQRARLRLVRPNAIPADFSDNYHVYDDQGIRCYDSSADEQIWNSTLFRVWIDDNRNPGPENRVFYDDFDTQDEAIAACRVIVDKWIQALITQGVPAGQMLEAFRHGGEDPFIEKSLAFSAWNYAEQQIKILIAAEASADPKL